MKQVRRGHILGHSIVQKFGRDSDVMNGVWGLVSPHSSADAMPASGSPVRIKAGGDVADTADGAGARSVLITGITDSFIEASEIILPSGIGVSQPTSGVFWRVYRAKVMDVGTYGAANTDDMIIETANGSSDRVAIIADEGHTQHAAFSIPSGSIGYLTSLHVQVDSSKAASIRVFTRENFNVVTAPMSSKNLKLFYDGILGTLHYVPDAPNIIIPGMADIWVEARGGGANTEVSIEMEILIIDESLEIDFASPNDIIIALSNIVASLSGLTTNVIAEFNFFPDSPPDIVGELVTGIDVNIELWQDGVSVALASSGCSEIDDTGRYSWSVGSGVTALTNRRQQYHWRMTDSGTNSDQGDFALLATASDDGNMPPLDNKGSYIIGG